MGLSFDSILIVDDEPSILKILSHYLAKYSKKVDIAENGLLALEKCAVFQYDLILSDISMPEMNGIDFLKRLRDKGDRTPFIFISAYGQQKGELLNSDFAVTDFIIKPVTKKPLLDLLEGHFGRK